MGNAHTEEKKRCRARGRAKEIVKTRLWKYINCLDLQSLDTYEIIKPFELAKQGNVLYWRSYFGIELDYQKWLNSPLRESTTI